MLDLSFVGGSTQHGNSWRANAVDTVFSSTSMFGFPSQAFQEPQPQDKLHENQDLQPTKQITITISLPSDNREDSGQLSPGTASIQTTAKPEDIRRLLGIPGFQQRDQQPTYTGQRNYNYEEKYPDDKPEEENGPDSQFFKVYLDEAEIFDQDKIRSHRDNLDSLLVFAALFSAVVTTFVVQTSQALQPDQSLITNHLLLNQIEVLKVINNTTAIAGIASSKYLPDTPTHSASDVWVNGLFFISLSLSLSAALLSVLAKQWLQAYDSSTSGNARDRALVRHLRHMGLEKWKLDEIIGALPLVLHASVAIFLTGLAVFLRALYPPLSWIIITISGSSFMLYLCSVVLPAIDIECPYRIPLLYRPMRYLIMFLATCCTMSWTAGKWLWSAVPKQVLIAQLQRFWSRLCGTFAALTEFIQTYLASIPRCLQHVTIFNNPTLLSLRNEERLTVQNNLKASRYLHHSILWLHEMSSNLSVQRVAGKAVAGDLCKPSRQFPHPLSIHSFCTPRLIHTITNGLFDGDDVPFIDTYTWTTTSPSPWVRALEKLCTALPAARPLWEKLEKDLWHATQTGRVNHVKTILECGVDANVTQPDTYGAKTLLYIATLRGYKDIVDLLLYHGAKVDLEAGQSGHETALIAASFRGDLAIVKLLLQNGANVRLAGGWYGSALQSASANGHFEIVKLLVEKGADINVASGVMGRPAIRLASDEGHSKIVQFLLEKGANASY